MRMEKRKEKIKKFRPAKQFRYLSGSIDTQANMIDLQCYNAHRYRVFSAQPQIDYHPLPMNPYNLMNIRKLSDDLLRSEQVDKENKELVKKINMINRNGGKVDSYNALAYRRTNKWQHHEMKMKEIVKENIKLYHKLLFMSKSYYDRKFFNEQWHQTLKQMKHGSRYPVTITNKVSIDNQLRSQRSISEGLEKGNVMRPMYVGIESGKCVKIRCLQSS